MGSASRLCLTNLSGPTHRLPLSVRFRERDCRYTRAIFITIFCEFIFITIFCFSPIIDASIDLVRCFPFSPENNKKAKSMRRSCKFEGVISQKLEGTWLFMSVLSEYLHL